MVVKPAKCGSWTGFYCTVKRLTVAVLVNLAATSGRALRRAVASTRAVVTSFHVTLNAPAVRLSTPKAAMCALILSCMEAMTERNIELSRVVGAVLNGEIVEDYPTDYPFPSCLMLYDGLHVVAGLGDGKAWLITAYIPSRDEWESDLKTRRTKQ